MRKFQVKKKAKKSHQIRQQIIKTAAKLMYEEGVSQYFDAKRIAARRLFKQGGGGSFRVIDLPSNGEIANALAELAQLKEGDARTARLFAMRIVALDIMENLSNFNPRLIGSVSTGRIRASSDIDIHVFTDCFEILEEELRRIGWHYETKQVLVQKNGRVEEYTHVFIDSAFPVELSVYPSNDLRVRGRSSTDGKRIISMKAQVLQALTSDEHNEAWVNYLQTGEIAGISDHCAL